MPLSLIGNVMYHSIHKKSGKTKLEDAGDNVLDAKGQI